MHMRGDVEPMPCCEAAEKIVECKGAKCINLQTAVSLFMNPDAEPMDRRMQDKDDHEGHDHDMPGHGGMAAYERQFAVVKVCDSVAEMGVLGSEAEIMAMAGVKPPAPPPAPPPPAPAPPPAGAPAPKVVIVEETFVESKIEVVQEFPPDTTSDSLMKDTAYVDTLQESTAESIGVNKDDVTITGLDLKDVTRRLAGSARRLQVKKALTVDYKVKVKDAAEAEAVKQVLEDDTLREAAQKKFEEKYIEKETERTGEPPKGLEVKQEAKVEVKVEEKEVIVDADPDTPVADEADLAVNHFIANGLAFILAAGQIMSF